MGYSKIYSLFFLFFLLGCNKNISKVEDVKSNTAKGEVIGCGSLQVYQLIDDFSYISIKLNANKLKLSNNMQFDLSQSPIDLSVTYEKYDGIVKHSLCNDVIISRPNLIINEVALKGELIIHISESEQIKYHKGLRYAVDISLDNLAFESKNIKNIKITAVQVGWMAG